MEMPLQINGKLRATFKVASGATKEEIEAYIMNTESLSSMFAGREVKKVIIIPGKIANIVVG